MKIVSISEYNEVIVFDLAKKLVKYELFLKTFLSIIITNFLLQTGGIRIVKLFLLHLIFKTRYVSLFSSYQIINIK